MKILIINEYKTCSGAEIAVHHIKQLLLERNYEIFCLYMKIDQHDQLEYNEYVLNPQFGILDKICYNPILGRKLKKILHKINPDIVFLNNVFSAPITVFKNLVGYRVFNFVHDYSAVCPKSTCIDDCENVCLGFKFSDCKNACTYHGSKLKLMVKLWLVGRLDCLRREVVEKCISPGEALMKCLELHGHKSKCINNPVRYALCLPRTLINKVHKYVYLGIMNDNKGIYEMIAAFKKILRKNDDVELHMYGRIIEQNDYVKINSLINDTEKIVYHGVIAYDKISEVLCDSYALVVPSKWLESFGYTVLDGMFHRILVMGSNRGGTLEQISKDRGILFEVTEDSIYEALQKAENMHEDEYIYITNTAYDFVRWNNSYETYYNRLIQEF